MTKNYFKFTLAYNKQPLIERIFDADCYNQSVRYVVKLQDLSKQIRNDFINVLSKNNKFLSFDMNGYDLNETFKKILKNGNLLDKKNHENYSENLTKENLIYFLSKLDKQETITGFSYTLYINNNIIIERDFNVDNFNVNSLFSTNLIVVFNNWVSKIEDRIKKNDINLMWGDYDILNEFNLTAKEIRELSEDDRRNKLYHIHKKHQSLLKFIETTEVSESV